MLSLISGLAFVVACLSSYRIGFLRGHKTGMDYAYAQMMDQGMSRNPYQKIHR
jgi:hypothetical protein